MTTYIDQIDTLMGPIVYIVNDDGSLSELWFREGRHPFALEQRLARLGAVTSPDDQKTGAVRRQIAEYFAGERHTFDLPLAASGSAIQEAVWKELTYIPFGETITYGQLADAIGMPGEAQAVGAACAANPIPLIVPCHRVIAADGSLRGYSAGLHIKERLLAFERGQRFLAAHRAVENASIL
jgi:methylated-DNA-[protein]-cysteine S-methyltransferase